MSSDLLTAAHEELNGLFERTQAALDPWTSGLAKALAIIKSHLTPPDKGNSHE